MNHRLIRKVELRLFEDNATGDWGLAHKKTIESYGEGFNAFWGDIGIFHDVFEHYFEHEHKYFRDNYAMNIGGEMAAMGHFIYYVNELNIYKRRSENAYYTEESRAIHTTVDLIEECITDGYSSFGQTLESAIPNQKPIYESELEYEIQKSFRKIRGLKPSKEYYEMSKSYKDSVSLSKMRNLHRWGYRQAERMIPNTWKNTDTLNKFMTFWGNFCISYNAKTLASYGYKGIDFFIYKDKDQNISWKAILIGDYYGKLPNVTITEKGIMGDILY
jgi:hypothetical protein